MPDTFDELDKAMQILNKKDGVPSFSIENHWGWTFIPFLQGFGGNVFRNPPDGHAAVLGIRPEDMEDAALVSDAPGERRFTATVELREALGSDVIVHFTIAARPAITDDVRELAVDVGQEALERV